MQIWEGKIAGACGSEACGYGARVGKIFQILAGTARVAGEDKQFQPAQNSNVYAVHTYSIMRILVACHAVLPKLKKWYSINYKT